jgi:hypothetical protein
VTSMPAPNHAFQPTATSGIRALAVPSSLAPRRRLKADVGHQYSEGSIHEAMKERRLN